MATGTYTFYLSSFVSVTGGSQYTGSYAPTVVLGKSSAASGNRAQFATKERTIITYRMALDNSVFPTGATITGCTFSAGVYCSLANNANTTSKKWEFTLGGQTAEGTIGRTYSTAVASDTIDVSNITIDDFTGTIDFVITWANSENSGNLYIYGAQLVVTYEYEAGDDTLYLKQNGEWVSVNKIFKKENGSWVEKTFDIFETESVSQLIIG